MLTSNGLTFFSGVTKCRMVLGSVMAASRMRAAPYRTSARPAAKRRPVRPRLISAPRLRRAGDHEPQTLVSGAEPPLAPRGTALPALSASGRIANPVGPQELWPMPATPCASSQASTSLTAGLMKRPFWAGAK